MSDSEESFAATPVPNAFQPQHGPPFQDYQDVVRRAREEDPVFFWPELDAWVVTRYEDVYRVLTDTDHFTQAGSHEVANRYSPAVIEVLDSGPAPWTSTILFSSADGDEHLRIRSCMSRTFTPRRVADLEAGIRALVTQLIDGWIGDGEVEFVERFAYPLPVQVIVRFLGLPVEDCDQLREWTDDMTRLFTARLDDDEQLLLARQVVAFQEYALQHLLDRQTQPRDDYLTGLVGAASADDAPVTLPELIHVLTDGLILGGHETTKGALSNGIWHLLSQRDRWDSLVVDPSSAGAYVEELLRYEPPQNGFFRVVGKRVELSGVELEPGSSIFWLSSSANHDPRHFDAPYEFVCSRGKVPPILTFGQGAHYCIGAPLARAEMRIAFEELARRIPSVRLADPDPSFVPNPVLRHRMTVPLSWDVGAQSN